MAKERVEDCRVLDIGEFSRGGYLATPTFGTSRWTVREREVASIGWSYTGAGLRLHYSSASTSYDYTVPIIYTTLTSGGQRPWFACPAFGCGRRCSKLYLPPWGHVFACRACHDLAYETQQDRWAVRDPWKQLERIAARVDRLRSRLPEVEEPKRVTPPASSPPVKRPRGRPRTKRKYTRRSPTD